MFLFASNNFNLERYISATIEGRKGFIYEELPATVEFLILNEDWDIDADITDEAGRNPLKEIKDSNIVEFIPFAGPFIDDTQGVNGKVYSFDDEESDMCLGDTEVVGVVCQKVGANYQFTPAVNFLGMCMNGPSVTVLEGEALDFFKDDICSYLQSFMENGQSPE